MTIPDLHKLYKFLDNYCFDKKTIIKIGLQLLNLPKYLNYHKIIHRDIKNPNIVWWIIQNSIFLKDNKLHLIDYGSSEYMGKTF